MLVKRQLNEAVAGAAIGAAALWFLKACFAYHDAVDVDIPHHPVTMRDLLLYAVPTFLAGGAFGCFVGGIRQFRTRVRTRPPAWRALLAGGYAMATALSLLASVFVLLS